jgi:Mce-associated membrane protein
VTDQAEGELTAAPAAEPPAEPPADPVPERPTAGWRRWLPWALVAVFAIAAVVMTWVAASLERDLDEARSGDTVVGRAAGAFGEALFTVDYRDPEAWRDAVLAGSTGDFHEEFEEAFDGGSEVLVEQTRHVSTAAVDEVFTGDVDGDRAVAMVVLDLTQDGEAGPRDVPNLTIRLELERIDGRWLVDDFSYQRPPDLQPLDPSGTPSTTGTTAP